MKLEVGMYRRTNCGKIHQITEIDLLFEMTKQNCKKASNNIIDLVEKGDYVNGKEIIMDLKQSQKWYGKQKEIDFVTADGYTFNNEEIKRIVTKEQFKDSEYVVE